LKVVTMLGVVFKCAWGPGGVRAREG